jgi:DNA repair protein RadC
MDVREYDVFINEKRVPYLKEIRNTGLTDAECYCSPQKISQTVRCLYHAEQLPEEHVWLLVFDAKNHLIGIFEVSRGSYTQAALNPAQILQRALLCGAVGIALVHNHPSGDPEPSREDRTLTERIKAATNLCGIEFIDHVIVGGAWSEALYSFREEGMI